MEHGFPQIGPQLTHFPKLMGHSPNIFAGKIRVQEDALAFLQVVF
jgi:hypothetical protein